MSNSNEILIKTLRQVQLEKLLIIFKELRHIYSILNFYYDENSKTRIDKTFRHLKESTKEMLNYIRELMFALKNQKDYEIKNNFINREQEYILFIIEYDKNNLTIKEALSFMEIVTKKIRNVFNEGINQYLPRPILGRRYSSFNMLLFFEEYYNNIYGYILDEENEGKYKKILLNWDYIDSYIVLDKNEILEKEYYYINMAYWYYEIPYLTPAFTHELSHIVLKNIDSIKNENLKIIYKKLKEHFNELYSNSERFKEISSFDKKYTEGIVQEIISDMVAFFIHGDSYLFTFIHSVVINDINNLFFSEGNKYILNKMEFSFERDFSIARSYILLIIREILINEDSNYEKFLPNSEEASEESKVFFNNIYSLLNVFFPISEDIIGKEYCKPIYKYGLKQIYENYPNIKDTYEKVFDFIEFFLIDIKKFILLNKTELVNVFKDLKKFKYNLKIYRYWEDRINYFYNNKDDDTLKDKYYIRELVANTLKETSKNEYHDNILLSKDLENYEIVYIKTKYNQGKDYQKLKSFIKNYLDNTYNTQDLILYDVLGIYDFLYFRRIDDKNKIHHQINSKEYLTIKDDIKFYENRYSLLKISEDIFFNKNNDNTFLNAIINIEIGAKKNTNELLSKLYIYFHEFIENIQLYVNSEDALLLKKISFFKSLGPKDFILIIEQTSANTIFKLKEYLNKLENSEILVKRTFTSVFLNESDKELHKKDLPIENYCLCTTFRFSISNYQRIKDKLKNEKCINRILITPGILDFQIEWNKNVKIYDIIKIYNIMMSIENGAIDIVTNLYKVLDI